MKTILCATDLTPCSENAIEYADELAQITHANLVLFHSVPFAPVPELATPGDQPFAPSAAELEELNSRSAKLKAIERYHQYRRPNGKSLYESVLVYGQSKETIPAQAQQINADLVVLGTEGAESLKEVLSSPVLSGAIQQAPCPVLIVPEQAKFRPLRKILFATELKLPLAQIGFLKKLASLFQAEVLLLHILTEESAAAQEAAQEEMIRICESMPYKNCSFFTETHPHIEEGISQFARRQKPDMLVLGYHPDHFGQHLFPADHAQEMAYHTYLPLLILPA
jgi:nucleotide-binding universal stress UspA family protein